MDHERYRRMHGRSGASMKKASFEVSLKGKKQIAEGTWAFVFERPDGFRFKAGQHVRMKLIHPSETDGEGDSRFFSLASTPQDPDLVIAMRMRDTAFKRVLGRVQIGDKVLIQVLLDVPHGAFALHDDPSRPAVFLVGGIGIAPAFSMIKDAVERKLSHRLLLFYSNRRPEDAPYLEELQKLAEQVLSLKVIATMTVSATPWHGETGRIERSMLAKHVGDLKSPNYYVSGLPEMVSAMKTMLEDSGVGEDRVHAEEFTGFNLSEIHTGAGVPWKRHAVIAAIALAAIVVVILHAGIAVSIFHNGLSAISEANPIWYGVVGISVVLVIFKIRYFVGRHLVALARRSGV